MKFSLSSIWAILLLLAFTACSKDPVSQTPQSPQSPQTPTSPGSGPITPVPADTTDQETSPSVLTAVYTPLNNSIGGFYEALPAEYDSTTKNYPLLVTLHGVDDMGDGKADLPKVLNRAVPKLLKEKKFPAAFISEGVRYSLIVISPQFRIKPSAKEINEVISYAVKNYRVDTSRMYVTGHSMGGGLAWDYAVEFGSRIAAVIPICGVNPYVNEIRSSLIARTNLPVWAFHNENDPTVPVNTTRQFVTLINDHKPNPLSRQTIWSSGGHDAWTRATNPASKEDGLNMYEWMLRYKR